MREIDLLLSKCADVISDAQRREVPLDLWTTRAHETLDEIYTAIEKLESEKRDSALGADGVGDRCLIHGVPSNLRRVCEAIGYSVYMKRDQFDCMEVCHGPLVANIGLGEVYELEDDDSLRSLVLNRMDEARGSHGRQPASIPGGDRPSP